MQKLNCMIILNIDLWIPEEYERSLMKLTIEQKKSRPILLLTRLNSVLNISIFALIARWSRWLEDLN